MAKVVAGHCPDCDNPVFRIRGKLFDPESELGHFCNAPGARERALPALVGSRECICGDHVGIDQHGDKHQIALNAEHHWVIVAPHIHAKAPESPSAPANAATRSKPLRKAVTPSLPHSAQPERKTRGRRVVL